MDEATFWMLIEQAKTDSNDDDDQQVTLLVESLAQMPVTEIEDFDAIFRTYRAQAYHWDLWAAAYVINGGCSDDGFIDFRAWLIAQGRDTYYQALQNADWLAEVVETDYASLEVMSYVASRAYEQKTGQRLYDSPRVKSIGQPADPAGQPWDDDDELAERLPNLWRKFWD